MNFFKPQQPILQKKKLSLNSEELGLMKCLRIKSLEKLNLCGLYTCVDQAMLIWGIISGVIFICAQFLPISWIDQAIFWSIITLLGVVLMSLLTYSWSVSERVTQVVYLWVFLMITGMIITDYAIVSSWGLLLGHLCELWLTLSAIGYALTGWILRSRAFFLAAIIHSLTIIILASLMEWQFLITGLVMMSNLLIFSEGQWDMLLPREITNYFPQSVSAFSFNFAFRYNNHLFMQIYKSIIICAFIEGLLSIRQMAK